MQKRKLRPLCGKARIQLKVLNGAVAHERLNPATLVGRLIKRSFVR